MFSFDIFTKSSSLNTGPTVACYQEWKYLDVRAMVAEIKLKVATNIIFTTVLVSLLTLKYWFSWLWVLHFIPATKIHFWRISTFTGYSGKEFVTSCLLWIAVGQTLTLTENPQLLSLCVSYCRVTLFSRSCSAKGKITPAQLLAHETK